MSEVLVKAEGVSKKFCRSLKRSLWYGVQDIFADLNPFRGNGSHSLSDGKIGRAANTNGAAESPTSTVNLRAADHGQNGLRRDEFWAVNDVSFEVKRGECLGLIGRNGAGKTTLLKMLNGLIRPDKGRIEMRGRVGALIALGAGFNPILTGRENIYVNGAVLGLAKQEIDKKIDDIIDFAELREFINSPVQSYSSGMQVRLGFAVATALKPDILLLDEVLAVGDISFRAKCFNVISQFRQRGTSFVLVSHNMHQINRYCNRVLYLKSGGVEWNGDTEAGVQRFAEDMAGHLGEFDEGGDFSKIYGSGKLQITAIFFLDTLGNQVRKIKTGDPILMRVEYDCKEREVMDPLIDVVIRDRDGNFFQGTNIAYGQRFEKLSGRGAIDIFFETLPANNQKLLCFVSIMNERTKEIHDWKRNIPIEVQGKSNCDGRVHLPCQWSITRY